jgi:biotin carboxyl carrier protein
MKAGAYTSTIDGVAYSIKLLSDETVEVNGVAHKCDFAILGNGSFSLIMDGNAYAGRRSSNQTGSESESRSNATLGRTISLGIDGTTYHIRVDDERSRMARSLVVDRRSAGGSYLVKAPMPGLITRIEVNSGAEVDTGTGLLVLEAMKMENEIRSQKRGKVGTIHVEVGKAVEKGELLMSITEL